jgi:hypothetical protein
MEFWVVFVQKVESSRWIRSAENMRVKHTMIIAVGGRGKRDRQGNLSRRTTSHHWTAKKWIAGNVSPYKSD